MDDPDQVTDPVQRLAREYVEARRRTGAEWLYVQQPWDGELQYDTFSYLPEQHFRQAYDQITGDAEDNPGEEDVCCRQCGGSLSRVRTDQRAHLAVEYYRCQADEGCRQGGERVYDQAGELIRTAGPVFEDGQQRSVAQLLEPRDRDRRDQTDVEDEGAFEPDGGYDTLHAGTRRSTVYYWLDPETGATLPHTDVNDHGTIPFFADEPAARAFLENRAEAGDADRYAGLSLYKARTRKVADAVDVLTEQAGFDEYVPDG
ncbi:hypothetical protein [Halobiforma nitratireducens]|uniref:hypothetical protein n=1 Tax=Halobiforma nitratireducens TaxID=130048 RepID=UPI0012698590|nr:hypothetical protein [Halobiforma nitratireducens]